MQAINQQSRRERLAAYRRNPFSLFLAALVTLSAVITLAVLISLIIYILYKGIPNLKPSLFAWNYNTENVSMMPAIINTLSITAMTLLFSVPAGIFAAIYLVEYAKRGNKFVSVVRMTTETLAGIPSIVFGLFGYLFFNIYLKWGYSILGGALLLTAANLLLRLISIAFQVFLSVRIGAAGLGLMQLISTIGVFAMLAGTAGVRVTAMYLAAEEFGHRRLSGVRAAMRACLQYGILVSAVSGAALFFLSDFFAQAWLRDLRAAPSLRVMGLLLPFSCLCGIMTGYYTACSRIRQLVGIEIAERLVSVGLTVTLLYLWAGDDLARACCAITFGSSAGCIFDFTLLYLRYRRDMRRVPREHIPMRKRLLRLSVPLALNDALRAGLNTAEQLLIPIGLARYGGSTEEAMAGYGTIHGMVFPILMFPAAILYSVSDLLVPELSRCRAMGRGLRVRDLSGKCIRMTILFAAAVAGFFFVCAEELGQCVYHSADAGRYLRIFAPMVLMLYLDAIVDGMLKGLAEQLSCVRYNTLTSVLDVVFLYVLLPRHGVAGYVAVFAVTHAINLYLSIRRLLVATEHRPRAADFALPLLSLGLALLLTLPSPAMGGWLVRLLCRGGWFLTVLLAAFVLLQALTQQDGSWLRRVLRRTLDNRGGAGYNEGSF